MRNIWKPAVSFLGISVFKFVVLVVEGSVRGKCSVRGKWSRAEGTQSKKTREERKRTTLELLRRSHLRKRKQQGACLSGTGVPFSQMFIPLSCSKGWEVGSRAAASQSKSARPGQRGEQGLPLCLAFLNLPGFSGMGFPGQTPSRFYAFHPFI